MSSRKYCLVLSLLFFASAARSQNWQWIKQTGAAGPDNGNSLCADGSGNCYVAVDSSGHCNILKYNSTGALVWNTAIWTGNARSIFSDNARYLYIAGDSSNQMLVAKCDTSGNVIWKINGGEGVSSGISLDNAGYFYLTGSGSFLQKYDTSGNQTWIRNALASGYSICNDNLANCYITGMFSGTVSFGTNNLTALGSQDIFVTKYDSAGNCIWAKRAGGSFTGSYSKDCGYAIATDNIGSIYFTGSVVDTAGFDSFTLIASSNDVFLAKYDTGGNALWVQQAGGLVDQEGRSIALDNQGNVLIGGSYVPDIYFDGLPMTGWGNYDAFIARYDSSGNFLDVMKAGGAAWNEYVYGICTDNSGSIFATGSFSGTSFFDGDILTSSGSYDIFVSKLDFTAGAVEGEPRSSGVRVYPNPSKGSFTIEADHSFEIHQIVLTDMLGQVVFSQLIRNPGRINFNMGDIPEGVYILQVHGIGGKTLHVKIIALE